MPLSQIDPPGIKRSSAVRANLSEDGPKRPIEATVVKVLKHRREDRGMLLEPFTSRCVRAGEVHELVTTDQADTGAGARVDRVGFLGFAEIANAGVIDRGDRVLVDGTQVGIVLGFDACHFPNHYNVLIVTDRPTTGPELAVRPETKIAFVSGLEAPAAPAAPDATEPMETTGTTGTTATTATTATTGRAR